MIRTSSSVSSKNSGAFGESNGAGSATTPKPSANNPRRMDIDSSNVAKYLKDGNGYAPSVLLLTYHCSFLGSTCGCDAGFGCRRRRLKRPGRRCILSNREKFV